jgi:hypothetical protein
MREIELEEAKRRVLKKTVSPSPVKKEKLKKYLSRPKRKSKE